MCAQRGIILFAVPREHRDLRARRAQHGLHRLRRAAGAQHQRLFAGLNAAVALQKPTEAVKVGILAVQRPVRTAHKGIDAAQRPRSVRKRRAEFDHRTLIGNRHIQAVKTVGAQEVRQRIRRDLEQLVGVFSQKRMDLRRIAVRQVLPQKPAAHHTTSE